MLLDQDAESRSTQATTPASTTEAPAASSPTTFTSHGAIPNVGTSVAGSPAASASDRAFGPAQPATATPDSGWITDDKPSVIDGGVLGKTVTVDAATANAHTELASAEAVVTSVDENMQPTFAVTANIPISQIHAAGMTPDKLAQITAVHLSTGAGAGGTLGYRIGDGQLQISLAAIQSIAAFNVTNFKLLLGSGESVMLGVTADTFHTDIAEWKRADLRDQIRQDQRFIDQARAAEAASDPEILSAQQRVQNAQKQLAAITGPVYVTFDEHGLPVKQPAAPG